MADTLELVEIPPDQKRLADDVLIRHESPVPAVLLLSRLSPIMK